MANPPGGPVIVKTALICPGQGAQVPGGVALLPDGARAVFDRASRIIGLDLWEAGLHADQATLAMPSLLQPFLVAWAVADLARAEADYGKLPAPDFVLGHSSGENSALALSGATSFEAAVRYAAERGALLDEACVADDTGLLALAGVGRDAGEQIAAETGLDLANHNAFNQVVLGGRRADIERAVELVKARGTRAVVLRVAGAFHSEHFADADRAAQPLIDGLEIADTFTPLIGNASGQVIDSADGLRAELTMQFTRPIEWVAALQSAYDLGVRTVMVTGPGNAMNGLVRRFAQRVEEPVEVIRLNRHRED